VSAICIPSNTPLTTDRCPSLSARSIALFISSGNSDLASYLKDVLSHTGNTGMSNSKPQYLSCVCSWQPDMIADRTVRYIRISSNTTIDYVVCYLLYVNHNYTFRSQVLAIFRLYNGNLSISYTCICRGCGVCRGALDLGWLGTINRQSTMPTCNYL